jgi:DNA-binding response OmpR family regulator
MRVLVVEDQVRLANTLARGLRNHAMAVDVAYDGIGALEKAELNRYDVVVLDRDLPGVHGDDVCRRLREANSGVRIIMVTAASSLDDMVTGLDLGADDYLPKPFDLRELLARLRALGRRGPVTSPTVLRWADLEVDPARMVATRAGAALDLTPREHAVLTILVRAEGGLVSAEELFEKAWDERSDPFTTSVRVIVSRLRAKLGEPPLIETVVTRGYRMAEPDGITS